MITDAEIEARMGWNEVDDLTAQTLGELRHVLITAAKEALEITPVCREQSLMVTHLEEALMWGSKALSTPPV